MSTFLRKFLAGDDVSVGVGVVTFIRIIFGDGVGVGVFDQEVDFFLALGGVAVGVGVGTA